MLLHHYKMLVNSCSLFFSGVISLNQKLRSTTCEWVCVFVWWFLYYMSAFKLQFWELVEKKLGCFYCCAFFESFFLPVPKRNKSRWKQSVSSHCHDVMIHYRNANDVKILETVSVSLNCFTFGVCFNENEIKE